MRKILVLVLAMLMAIGAVAYAAVPSKTTTDMTGVVAIEAQGSIPADANFTVAVAEESEAVNAEIANLYAYVTQTQAAPVTFFDQTVQTAVAEVISQVALEETVDLEALELNEFVPLQAMNYDPEYGDVRVAFTFATQYSVDQVLVALLGFQLEDGTMEWIAVPAEATEDGGVIVSFSQEALVRLQEAPAAAIAILNTPAA